MATNVIWKLGKNIIITLFKQYTEYNFLRHFFCCLQIETRKNSESNNLENSNVSGNKNSVEV